MISSETDDRRLNGTSPFLCPSSVLLWEELDSCSEYVTGGGEFVCFPGSEVGVADLGELLPLFDDDFGVDSREGEGFCPTILERN